MLRVVRKRKKFQHVDISRGSQTSFWMPRAEASVGAGSDKDWDHCRNIFTFNYKCFVILSSVPVMLCVHLSDYSSVSRQM